MFFYYDRSAILYGKVLCFEHSNWALPIMKSRRKYIYTIVFYFKGIMDKSSGHKIQHFPSICPQAAFEVGSWPWSPRGRGPGGLLCRRQEGVHAHGKFKGYSISLCTKVMLCT